MDAGLVGGEGFAVDASVVKADARRQKHHQDDDDWGDGSRAVREYLDALADQDGPVTSAKKMASCWRHQGS
jgi:hypothetical protein